MKSRFYLPWNSSKTRLKEAEEARKNRLEIVQALSWGQISRRELIKWGLFTAAGALAPIKGRNPFMSSAYAEVPTGAPSSPGLIGLEFTQPMLRLEVLPRNPISSLNPAPMVQSNETLQRVDPMLGGGFGPIEGRPPGPNWAHQRFAKLPPKVAVEVTQQGARTNPNGNIPFKFHPNLPAQGPLAMWTFNGTIPPKLVLGRYGEPILFRHHNKLPVDVKKNGGFGCHTISTHEHNGHHGAENIQLEVG
jgi:manganese oxidase